jgi:hypothetical protein
MTRLTRRQFLKLAGSAAASGLLAGCTQSTQEAATPVPETAAAATDAPAPTLAPDPTDVPTVTPEVSRAEIIKFYPDGPSRVVRAHHAGVWDDEALVPDVLRRMLDGFITALTGLEDARDAWAVLFSPDERIAIKVNSISGGATHPALVMAVAECLQDVGVPAEQIVIFDRNTTELTSEGYPVNVDGPGVRCYGNGEHWSSPGNYKEGWTLLDRDVKLCETVLECDALINIPILKVAGGPGISFGMKNHYGTFDIPWGFHAGKFERAIGELNALSPIKDRTRLIVGDLLTPGSRYGGIDGYELVGLEDAILASFDPVAFDAVGLQIASEYLTSTDRSPDGTIDRASRWLAHAAEIGLGTDDPAHIDLVEVKLA